jgi:uncharacterized protein YbcC (UPF0753/DUF2309 family)
MQMSDDLVKCLRNRANGIMHWVTVERMATEAADRIEQLEAALRKIACDGEPYDKCHCVNSEECSYGIARAALKEKKDGD